MLTPEEIERRARKRQEEEEAAREEAVGRVQKRYELFRKRRAARLFYRGDLQVGDRVYQNPMIEMTPNPYAIVVTLRCPARGCHALYQVTRLVGKQSGQALWLACRVCRSPVTIRDVHRVFGTNTFPIDELLRGMEKKDELYRRWVRFLREMIAATDERQKHLPPERRSVLIDKCDEDSIPEIQVVSTVESEEETRDSITREQAKRWGMQVDPEKKHFLMS